MLKLFTNAIKKKTSQDIYISKDTTENPKPSNNYVPEVESTGSNVTNETNSYEKNKTILNDHETTALTEKAGGTSDCKRSISIRKENSYSGIFQPELLSPLKPSRLYGSPESLSGLSEFLSSSVYQNSLTYLVVRKSSSRSDIEILYPIDNVKVDETIKRTSQNCKDIYENDPIYHSIYSKHIISSKTSLYHSILKQVYNDFTILDAMQVSPAGEPTITIKSECFIGADTELR
ncbi:6072_t:CDS:1, partial [Dentiscutata heterogama]